MRLKAKRDSTEQSIKQGLELAGYSVMTISEAGKPDLLVCKDGQAWLVECKSKGGKLTPAQERFIATWTGCPVIVARSASEVLGQINPSKKFAKPEFVSDVTLSLKYMGKVKPVHDPNPDIMED